MRKWCEHCRDHFDEEHYSDDGYGAHKVGYKYGPTGASMREREILNKVMDHAIDMWHGFASDKIREMELHESLGLTWQEYKEWATKEGRLYET